MQDLGSNFDRRFLRLYGAEPIENTDSDKKNIICRRIIKKICRNDICGNIIILTSEMQDRGRILKTVLSGSMATNQLKFWILTKNYNLKRNH